MVTRPSFDRRRVNTTATPSSADTTRYPRARPWKSIRAMPGMWNCCWRETGCGSTRGASATWWTTATTPIHCSRARTWWGAHIGCDVVLDAACKAISRTHLIVEPLANGRILLTDLSSHGTEVATGGSADGLTWPLRGTPAGLITVAPQPWPYRSRGGDNHVHITQSLPGRIRPGTGVRRYRDNPVPARPRACHLQRCRSCVL